MTLLGDIIYGSTAGTRLALAGNTTAVKQYLTQTGNGSVSAAPAWFTPSSLMILGCTQAASSTLTNSFIGIWFNTRITTEALCALTIDYGFTVKRLRGIASANTLNATTTFAFRDDGADVTTATLGATTTGEFDSGAVSVAVAAGSKCNFRVDSSGSASGSMTLHSMMVECFVALQ
jgi:hypothetical protein